MVEEAAVALIL